MKMMTSLLLYYDDHDNNDDVMLVRLFFKPDCCYFILKKRKYLVHWHDHNIVCKASYYFIIVFSLHLHIIIIKFMNTYIAPFRKMCGLSWNY